MKQIFILFLLWFGLSLSAQDQISLLFVGDLMQHQAQIDAARQGDGYNYNDCFRHVKKEISEADMAIGNLEVTLGGKPYRGYPAFSAPDEYLHAIKESQLLSVSLSDHLHLRLSEPALLSQMYLFVWHLVPG